MKIASFNIQKFGLSKTSDPTVLSILVKVKYMFFLHIYLLSYMVDQLLERTFLKGQQIVLHVFTLTFRSGLLS